MDVLGSVPGLYDLSNQRRFNIYWGAFTDGKGGHISPFIKEVKTVPAFYFLLVFFFNGDQGGFGLVCFEEEYSICGIFLG